MTSFDQRPGQAWSLGAAQGWLSAAARPTLILALGMCQLIGCAKGAPVDGDPKKQDLGADRLILVDSPGTDSRQNPADGFGDAAPEDSGSTNADTIDGLAASDVLPPDLDSNPPDIHIPCPTGCDDQLDCTDDRCEGDQCVHTPKADFCVIEGSCVAAGERDGETCAACDPKRATDAFSDDASLCAPDGVSCTDDLCQAGICVYPLSKNVCRIGGACYAAGDLDPAAECMGCNPTKNANAFSRMSDGTPCQQDNLPCTDDVCQGGKCLNLLRSTSCLIGGTCYDTGQPNAAAPCQHCDPISNVGTWTNKKDGAACADDSLECTTDLCSRGVCEHALKSDRCLIGGVCFKGGDQKAGSECVSCQPALSTAIWNPSPDQTPCTDDLLSCTVDRCVGGSCKHSIAVDTCLIAGTCYASDAAVDASGCTVCMPSRSSNVATVIDGQVCSDQNAQTHGDTCLLGRCQGFAAYTYIEAGESGMEVKSMAPIEGNGLWVVGVREDAAKVNRGFLAKVDGQTLTISLVADPLWGLHHRIAVGDGGRAYYHNGSSWTVAGGITSQLGTTNLKAAWGARQGSRHLFYVGGDSSGSCTTATNGTSFSCSNIPSLGSTVAGISGTSSAPGSPLWAISGGDILYSSTGVTFSPAGPHGCDSTASGAPCPSSSDLLGLWVRDNNEAWAVGDKGVVLRYNGSGWSSVAIPNLAPEAPQANYVFRSVFGSGDLVMLVGERNFANQYHHLVVAYYNRVLDRWFPPRLVIVAAADDPHLAAYRLNTGGAQTPDAPHFGGSLWDNASGKKRALFIVPRN